MSSVDTSSIKKNRALNKYRGILIAVTLFLIFDLAVLVLNLYWYGNRGAGQTH